MASAAPSIPIAGMKPIPNINNGSNIILAIHPHIMHTIDAFILPTAWNVFSNTSSYASISVNKNAILEYLTPRPTMSLLSVNIDRNGFITAMHETYLLSLLLRKVTDSQSLIAACEGVLKIAIFMGYITLISRMKDIQRVFMYHGAEHKCINCIEHGMELNVENVMKSSREHKRCGTSFLLIVMVVSIILHMFIRVDSKTLGFVIRILLLPVVAGISYEFIRLAGTSDNRLVALLSKPGMALQHMTTREPGPDMVEVAIASVEAVFDWKKFLNENFGANYELTEKEYVVGETIVPGTEKKSAAQLKKTEEVTA